MAGIDGVTVANKPMFMRGLLYALLAVFAVVARFCFLQRWSVLAVLIVVLFAVKAVYNIFMSLHVEGEEEEEVDA